MMPITYHTIESLLAKTEEFGSCMDWLGYKDNNTPKVCHGGKMHTVRRLMMELMGKPVNGMFFGTTCGNQNCVNPEHISARTKKQHLKRMNTLMDHDHVLRITKLQKAAEARQKLSDEQIEMVRADDRSYSKIAADYGVSKGLIGRVKRNENRRQVSAAVNPFSGLMR